MADELEPVTQEFVADLSDYLEPIEDAADETEGFADVVEQATENLGGLRDTSAEAGEGLSDLRDKGAEAAESLTDVDAGASAADASLDGLAAAEDDATASTETFAESVARMRDEVYEAYPGIDEATAALLAEAGAAQAAGASNDEAAASFYGLRGEAGGLYDSLESLKDLLAGSELGDALQVTRTGMNQFLIETEEEADAAGNSMGGFSIQAGLVDDAMKKARNSTADFWEAVNALNPSMAYSESLAKDAKAALLDMGATEYEAAAGAQALAKAQMELDRLGGEGGGFLGAIANFFGGGGEGGGFSLGGLLGNVGSLTAGVGLAAGIDAALVGITGFISGLGASIIGIGSLVALGVPGFEKIAKAIDDSDKKLARLPADERGAVEGIKNIEDSYKSMAKAFEPDVFKIVNQGLKVANDLLPGLKEPADVTAGVVSKLLGQLDQLLSPKYAEVFSGEHGFMGMKRIQIDNPLKNFDNVIDPYIKTALPAFAHGLGEVGGAFENLLKTMSAKDVGDDIRDFFGTVTLLVRGAAHAVRQMMLAWDDIHHAYENVAGWTDTLVKETIADWDLVSKDTGRYWHDVAHAVSDAIDATRETVIHIGHDIEAAWDESLHAVEDATDAARETLISIGHQIEHDWDTTWSDVVSFTEGIPGKLERIFAGAGHWLWSAGVNFVEGLAGGIRSDVGHLLGEVENMASGAIGAAEHFLGIGSPSTITKQHGVWLMEGYAEGITEGKGLVEGALRSALGGLPGMFPGQGGAGGRISVTVPLTAVFGAGAGGLATDPAFLHFVQQQVQEAVLRYQTLNAGNGLSRITPGVRTA